MASEQLTPNKKRREDLTVEELKNLPWFKDRSDNELTAIIAVAKGFTRIILSMNTKEKAEGGQSLNKIINITPNPQKKAA